jgi:tetratricopeptide (TPR) repeat protein
MAALTADALWIQDTWRLRRVPLQSLDIVETRPGGTELILTFPAEASAERLTLTFASAAEAGRWGREIQDRLGQAGGEGQPDDRHVPDGVSLLGQRPDVPHVVLGQVEYTDRIPRRADRGLQLRAGMRGADAVVELQLRKLPELAWRARQVSGLAVRVEDAGERQRLRLCWYAEEIASLCNHLLVLLILQAVLLFLMGVVCSRLSPLDAPSGETPTERLMAAALGLAMLCAWPLVLVVGLRVLRWPQLLRPVGLAVLAATTGRGLIVWAAHFLAVRVAGATLGQSKLWVLADPVDWAFVIAGAVLCAKAWRLGGHAPEILPPEVQAAAARKGWSGGLLAVTGVYAVVVLGFIGISRYEASAYVLQPGVDPRREHEALLALNEGSAQANKGDLDAAERSWQRALRLWEELTARRAAPPLYRANLAATLNNLGWIRDRRGRLDEAEPYYARAVALMDALPADLPLDALFKQNMAETRQILEGLRGGKSAKVLDEKDRLACRKYEEAHVKADKADAAAEGLYTEAIALWEEILPQATSEQYRRTAPTRLVEAYLLLAELQQRFGKRAQAEASLGKAIDYGEKAVRLEPERALARHNLDVARRQLDGLRDQSLQEEISKLWTAERFADIGDLCRRAIAEQEEQVRLGKDRELAVRRLAYRLDRFAWFLAHCPDGRVRDTKAAVTQARRATELQPDAGDFWFTLTVVQYRNGDWHESLASLEKLKAREGGLDGSGWLVSAMDLYQLKRREEARAAFRKAVEWIDERRRQAEDNPLLRFQFEMMRPGLEALRREAEHLIEGRDPSADRVG